MDPHELLWRQYQQNVDLFRFYMDLTVKFNVFFYAVTGAIVSYVLANHNGSDIVQYAVILPIVMCIFFALFFVYGAVLMRVLRKDTFAIRDALGLRAAPDVGVLTVFLSGFAIMYVLIAIGCGVLICKL